VLLPSHSFTSNDATSCAAVWWHRREIKEMRNSMAFSREGAQRCRDCAAFDGVGSGGGYGGTAWRTAAGSKRLKQTPPPLAAGRSSRLMPFLIFYFLVCAVEAVGRGLASYSQSTPPDASSGCTSSKPFASNGYCYSKKCVSAFGIDRNPDGLVTSGDCPCITSNDCFYAWQGRTNLMPVCTDANIQTLTDGTCETGPTSAVITYAGVSSTSHVMQGCNPLVPCADVSGNCQPALCKTTCGDTCTCSSDSQCTGTWYRSLYTPVCGPNNYCVAASPYSCGSSCVPPSVCQLGGGAPVCASASLSPSPSPISSASGRTGGDGAPAGSTDGNLQVDLYTPGSRGFLPSCGSDDFRVFTQTTSANTCFGATTLTGYSGGVTGQVSFKLNPTGGNNQYQLLVYGGTTCSTTAPPVILGSSFACVFFAIDPTHLHFLVPHTSTPTNQHNLTLTCHLPVTTRRVSARPLMANSR
jgi:hypothetical protein